VAADREFEILKIRYERCLPPSAARQRNRGLACVDPSIGLIGFLDDDGVLEPGALGRMAEFWSTAGQDIGGASLNMINHPEVFAAGLKRGTWVERLGLYSGKPGQVLPSGFQVMIGPVRETTFVRWLGSGASIWRRCVVGEFGFDEWFRGYSYLEDLDFSYRIGKKYRLAVVAGANYRHLHAPHGRGSGFDFGRREAANRIYFVSKNPELDLSRCFLTLGLRMVISLIMAVRERKIGFLNRAAGTLVGIVQSFLFPATLKFRKTGPVRSYKPESESP
jgi:glycosyltransferase involved in cell wall biosynthesis